jgi:alkanesulfonate monooxygenase SsuD/methylene tetrahydromethanopterin reductase-like flavin-dependent oxidoreductase (luciferase family)
VDLEIGYESWAEQFGPRELVELAVQAEELGLDSVMISDHVHPWWHKGGHVSLKPVGHRAGVRHVGLLYPGRVVLGIDTARR